MKRFFHPNTTSLQTRRAANARCGSWAIPSILVRSPGARHGLRLVLTLVILMVSLRIAPITYAATVCVNPTGAGGCSQTIQAAINLAAPGDTITIAAGTYVENLSVDKNITISGAGASATMINGNNAARVWTIFSTANLNLTNLTITYGFANDFGGGIYNDGTMTLKGVSVTSNNALAGSGITNFGTMGIDGSTIANNSAAGSGGGIVNGGTLTIANSTISGNHATGDGGGIYHSGGTLTITNSTISGNTATGSGGGIVNFAANPVDITNSTISGNTATSSGGGIVNGGTLTLTSSTVFGNQGAVGNNIYNGASLSFKSTIVATGDCALFGTVVSLGGNLDSGTTCGFNPAQGDLVSTNPLLGPLANNGGSTFTHALLANSPAINAAGTSGCPATDQRGIRRPQGRACDSGAFELEQASFPYTAVLDDFNRTTGKVGGSWLGANGLLFYRISSNQLDAQLGGPLVWRQSFGASQEAFVKLSALNSTIRSEGLLLKAQDSNRAEAGAILVAYDAKAQAVRVSAIRIGARDWTIYLNQSATFASGDVLGARALADGTVEVYRNGALLTSVKLNATDGAFFNAKGGRIGIWTLIAPKAFLDDFGGGTLTP